MLFYDVCAYVSVSLMSDCEHHRTCSVRGCGDQMLSSIDDFEHKTVHFTSVEFSTDPLTLEWLRSGYVCIL